MLGVLGVVGRDIRILFLTPTLLLILALAFSLTLTYVSWSAHARIARAARIRWAISR